MDDINTQLHDIEVGCCWCKLSSIGQHKLTRPTNISIRRSYCREQITPPGLRDDIWKKIWNQKMMMKEKCILSTRIFTLAMLSSRHNTKSTGHVLSSNTNNSWSQQLKFIQQTSAQLCHCQDINPPSVNMRLSADNIQMISYCKLTMTQMSCQLSHFNISHWILWHLCQSDVTLTPASQHSQHTGPGPGAPTNCDNLINTVTTDLRKCKCL